MELNNIMATAKEQIVKQRKRFITICVCKGYVLVGLLDEQTGSIGAQS